MRSVIIYQAAFDIGPGNVTQTINLDPLQLSWCKTLSGELKLPTIATDLADKLDIKFQETRDPLAATVYWDTRAYWQQVAGNTSASASTPYADHWNVSQDVDLTSSSRNYNPTGSSTGVELTAGTVRDGPFAPPVRTATGRITTQRIVAVISGDANNNARFAGTITLTGHAWDEG